MITSPSKKKRNTDRLLCCKQHVDEGAAPLVPTGPKPPAAAAIPARASHMVGARPEVAKRAICETGAFGGDISSALSLRFRSADQFPKQAVDDGALTRL